MESTQSVRLFKRLLRHPLSDARPYLAQAHRRLYLSQCRMRSTKSRNESSWQQRTTFLPAHRRDEYKSFPLVTAKQLKTRKERPRQVRMLMRDFIEDSLYNPHYGYFSKQAVIFTPGEPFDFESMRDQPEFYKALGERYTAFEDALDEEIPNETRQLWHTPTELFSPHYGEAIARYLLSNYIATVFPYHDLIIYEMGAGRGTLMLNILDYLREMEPQVYERTKYRVIEISASLADLQKTQVTASQRGHADKVEILNRSVFDWTEYVPSPCFFLAMEVFDNFPHDCIRYDLQTLEPLQGLALVDKNGDFFEFYEPILDKVAGRFFRVRHAATGGRYPVPYSQNKLLRALSLRGPGPFLSKPEYLPTRLMQFFDILEKYFPAHRLVTSDFHALPSACEGLNAPVVQTRYQRTMVPVSTPLVQQGYFDILFPTNFKITEALYQAITGKLTRTVSHEDFMGRWAYVELTETRSGENPLLSWYKNATVMVTA